LEADLAGTQKGVTCLGHAHPAITSAVTTQLSKISHSQVNIFHSLAQVTLIDRLLPHMPRGLDTFFFANSGAEAVENAVKVSKAFNGRRGVVVMQGGYHGRTYASSAMTSEFVPCARVLWGASQGGGRSDRRVKANPSIATIATIAAATRLPSAPSQPPRRSTLPASAHPSRESTRRPSHTRPNCICPRPPRPLT
jgi:hypothetical protein